MAALSVGGTSCSVHEKPSDGGIDRPSSADVAIPDGAGPNDRAAAEVPDPDFLPQTPLLRRGLAVIADFADVSLEDWSGAGFNAVAEVEAQLRRMEQHWAWLSRGLEEVDWDLVRVRLPQRLAPTAFPGLTEYRAEVLRLVREILDASRYDMNGDGVIDSVWIIAVNNGADYTYMNGGALRVADAETFADQQNSLSVVAGATGNFNHEFGHNVGLPDLYGIFESIGDLSLMASSWPVPPNDLSAYDRVRLGWVIPRVVDQTTSGLVLPPADTHLFAIKIPTRRAIEYFLLEYRVRPASGFGSASPPWDGVVVYHVLEGSSQFDNPPLLKVEPADGFIAAGTGAEVTDLLYPENAAMRLPLTVRSYFGDDAFVRIENVVRVGDSMQVDIAVGAAAGVNLLVNGTFEATTEPWTPAAWQPGDAVFTRAGIGRDSGHSLAISAPSVPNDVEWRQTVRLDVSSAYALCGQLRGENVVGHGGADTGANLSVAGPGTLFRTPGGFGTFDWTERCLLFQPADPTLTIACHLGGLSSLATGTVWCDDLSLTALSPAF